MRWPFRTSGRSDKTEAPEGPPADPASPATPPRDGGWFMRLRRGLSKSSAHLSDGISAIFAQNTVDEERLDALEEVLITADLGVPLAAELRAELAKARLGKTVTDTQIKHLLADQIGQILTPVALPLVFDRDKSPECVLFVGVNGSGKTTTIGKIAQMQAQAGTSPLLVAGDTFRAAAVEQLAVWGKRTGVEVIRGASGGDPAGLAFEALVQAQSRGSDLILIDTAGRLPNHQELMDELAKVTRVLKKRDPNAPHHVILVLDATIGQNALAQVQTFAEAVQVTGLIVTKLDGSAKGGVVVALAKRFGLPIHFVGVGEGVNDLRPFEAKAFARALVGLDENDPQAEAT